MTGTYGRRLVEVGGRREVVLRAGSDTNIDRAAMFWTSSHRWSATANLEHSVRRGECALVEQGAVASAASHQFVLKSPPRDQQR